MVCGGPSVRSDTVRYASVVGSMHSALLPHVCGCAFLYAYVPIPGQPLLLSFKMVHHQVHPLQLLKVLLVQDDM